MGAVQQGGFFVGGDTMAKPKTKAVASGIPVYCAYDEIVDTASVVPNPRNPNTHPEKQIELLARIIQKQGWRAPITISNRSGFIVRGHGRLQAAQKLGLEQVPVDRQNYNNEAEEWADLVADNRIAELAEMDDALLKDLLVEMNYSDLEFDLTGYSEKDLDKLLAQFNTPGEVIEDNFDAEAEAAKIQEPVTKRGDIWRLGNHRLMCGDSTNPADVQFLMDGKKAILFSTDPPYLVDYNGTNHPYKWNASQEEKERKNKDWSDSYGVTWDDSKQGPEFYEAFIRVAVEYAIEPNAAWYCWHASRNQAMLETVWDKFGAFVHQQIIWAKDRPILTRSHYMWQHEPCFFGWIKGSKPPRVSNDYPPTVWSIPTIKPGAKTEHPTSKPVELFAIPMRQHVKPGGICYEPFSGSGSQIMAAEMLGHCCYAMEIEPVYCDVAVLRWEQLTGQKAERLENIA